MVRALHEAGIEVILDVVYNHTAEGNHLGPTLCLRGIDNAAYYRLVADDPRYYLDYTGTGNSLNIRDPHTLQLIMDSLRYWVTEMHVDGFRFDLAADAGPRVLRRRPAVGVLRHRPAGSGDLPGQADRRTVGRRPRRLPGRQLPSIVDGVERQVPRHRARLLARRTGHPRRVRLPVHRLDRPLPGRRPPPVRVDQLHHRARRLHPARPGQLRRASTTRPTARTTATAPTTTGPGTAASKARPTTRTSLELRARQSRNLLATLMLVPGRADDAARRRDRPHPAGQQQRLLPGQRTDLDGLGDRRRGPRTARVHQRADRVPPRPPGVPPPALLRTAGPSASGDGTADIAWFTPGGRRDVRTGLGSRLRPAHRRVPQRRRHLRTRPARRTGGRRLVPAVLQRPPRGHRIHPAAGRNTARAGWSCWTPRPARCSPESPARSASDVPAPTHWPVPEPYRRR